MPELAVNGTRVHYDDRGEGSPVLFCHGLFWDGRMFDAQIAALQDRHRCVTMDFRGQGRSPLAPSGYDMDTLTEDAAEVVDRLGLGACHFVGLSMGGFVGMRLALQRPELVRSLTLIDTAGDPEPRRKRIRYELLGPLARAVGVGPFVGEIMRAMFGDPFLLDPRRTGLRDEVRRRFGALERVGATRALTGVIRRAGVEDALGRIAAPTLVLSGELDTSVTPERSRRTAAKIPGARFVLVPRAGHSSTVEEPAFVTAELAKHLAKN